MKPSLSFKQLTCLEKYGKTIDKKKCSYHFSTYFIFSEFDILLRGSWLNLCMLAFAPVFDLFKSQIKVNSTGDTGGDGGPGESCPPDFLSSKKKKGRQRQKKKRFQSRNY